MGAADILLTALFPRTVRSRRIEGTEGSVPALKADAIEPCFAGTDRYGRSPHALHATAAVGGGACGRSDGRPGQRGVGLGDPPRRGEGGKRDDDAMSPLHRVRDEIKAFIPVLPVSLSA